MFRISVMFSIGSAAVCLALAPAYAAPPIQVSPPHTAAVHLPSTHITPPASMKATPPAQAQRPLKTVSPQGATIAGRIEMHPQLAARLQPLLPAHMTLEQAANGFQNQGRFIAALHVAHNLNIPFDQLKAAMTGTTHDSLGQAIHALKPSINASMAVKTAEDQTKEDLTAAGRKTSGDASGR